MQIVPVPFFLVQQIIKMGGETLSKQESNESYDKEKIKNRRDKSYQKKKDKRNSQKDENAKPNKDYRRRKQRDSEESRWDY